MSKRRRILTVILQFLGSGGAFTPISENFQSNMIIKSGEKTLLIDCGSDARHSLAAVGLSHKDIDDVYISHLHADHVGGLEWLAFTNHFQPIPKRPQLYIHPSLRERLWDNVLSGGLQSLEGERPACLADFYEVMPIEEHGFWWNDLYFKLVQTIHVCNGNQLAPSYGLYFETKQTKVFLTTDTQFESERYQEYFAKADLIFHDCDTGKHISPVHAHFSQLAKLPDSIKAKMWLYHYAFVPELDPTTFGFLGFVKRGQEFVI